MSTNHTFIFFSGGVETLGTISLTEDGMAWSWSVCGIYGESITKKAAFEAMCATWKNQDENN